METVENSFNRLPQAFSGVCKTEKPRGKPTQNLWKDVENFSRFQAIWKVVFLPNHRVFVFAVFSCFPRCGKPLPFPRKSGKTNAKPNFSTAACQILFQKRQPAPQRGFANFINSKPQVTKLVFHQFSTGVENPVEK